MSVTLRYRLFKIGALPDDLRASVEPEGIRILREGVPVAFRFSGRGPGFVTRGSSRTYSGALVVTQDRVLATLATIIPKSGARSIAAGARTRPAP